MILDELYHKKCTVIREMAFSASHDATQHFRILAIMDGLDSAPKCYDKYSRNSPPFPPVRIFGAVVGLLMSRLWQIPMLQYSRQPFGWKFLGAFREVAWRECRMYLPCILSNLSSCGFYYLPSFILYTIFVYPNDVYDGNWYMAFNSPVQTWYGFHWMTHPTNSKRNSVTGDWRKKRAALIKIKGETEVWLVNDVHHTRVVHVELLWSWTQNTDRAPGITWFEPVRLVFLGCHSDVNTSFHAIRDPMPDFANVFTNVKWIFTFC